MKLAPWSALLAVFAISAAFAQATGGCPTLPMETGLKWERLDGPGFVFCKAIRESDGSEAFAVTLSAGSPFEPNKRDRAEATNIAGRRAYWYRSEIVGSDQLARETLVEIGGGRVAHISLNAQDAKHLTESMRQAEALGFADVRLSAK